MFLRRARHAVLGLCGVLAACGYDWTVVSKDEKSSSGSSGSTSGTGGGVTFACGRTVECASSKSFCVIGAKGDQCVPWTCSARNCDCEEAAGACAGGGGSCFADGDEVNVKCP